MNKVAHCDIHGIDYEQSTISIAGIEINTGCPECEKKMQDADDAKKEDTLEKLSRLRLQGMNIEPMYLGSTLESFVVSNQEQQRAKAAVERLVAENKGKIVMLGNHGTGKTHLAVGAVRILGGKILTMYEISTRIRATYTPRANEDELDVVDDLSRLPLLAIDEIGRTKGSDAETNWLSYIIDKRHVRGLPLILISNKHARRNCTMKDGCPNCLENYISEDIMSRLSEDGIVINFSGDDYRIKKRLAK